MVTVQTEVGVVMGTAPYMSPEQVRGEPVGPQSDIWALGVVPYDGLLVSDDPVAGGTVFRLDPATGQRDVWTEIEPPDPAGIMNLNHNTLVVTPDGRSYGYGWHRATSDLYVVEGLAS